MELSPNTKNVIKSIKVFSFAFYYFHPAHNWMLVCEPDCLGWIGMQNCMRGSFSLIFIINNSEGITYGRWPHWITCRKSGRFDLGEARKTIRSLSIRSISNPPTIAKNPPHNITRMYIFGPTSTRFHLRSAKPRRLMMQRVHPSSRHIDAIFGYIPYSNYPE